MEIAPLDIRDIDISLLKVDPHNARLHDERSIETMKQGLQRFGQRKNIVVMEDMTIVAGHALVAAAKLLGWTTLKVDVTKLKGDEARAYAILDNRSAEHSEWDWHELSDTLRSMKAAGTDIASLGFADYELDPLLAADWKVPEKDPNFKPSVDDIKVRPIEVTAGQRQTIERAIDVVRASEDDAEMTEGRAIELICADYLSGKVAQ